MAKKADKTTEETENIDALDLALLAIEKEFGRGSVFNPGKGTVLPGVTFCSSGSFKLNQALGGGYPLRRIIEIYGPESSGKSTLCLHAVAEAQRLARIPDHPWYGRRPFYCDVEHALDIEYAKNLGVDVDNILISQPSDGEDALNIVDRLMRSGLISVGIVDSVASLVTKAELAGDHNDSHVGRQARMMSQSLKMLAPMISNTNSILIFTNQIRMKIGVMFGNPETTSGGQALKFYASQRLDIRKHMGERNSDGEIGNIKGVVTVVKNKVAPPFRKAELEILFGTGVDIFGEVLDLSVEHDLVKKSGAWYSCIVDGQETRLGQGRTNTIEYLREHAELFEALKEGLVAELATQTEAEPLGE